MSRKVICILLFACLLLASVCPVYASEPTEQTAVPAMRTISVDGRDFAFYAYMIGDDTYVRARDLAAALAGTRQQFWTPYKSGFYLDDTVYLGKTYGQWEKYEPTGDEFSTGDGAAKTVVPKIVNACVDDAYQRDFISGDRLIVGVEGCKIDDTTYVKLRDVARAFDFALSWDAAQNRIGIDTETAYLASAYPRPAYTDEKYIIGAAYESERMLFINEMPILSYVIAPHGGGKNEELLYIVAEDLVGYGFDLSWNDSVKLLALTYNAEKPFAMMDGEVINGERSTQPVSAVYSDRVNVTLDGQMIDAYNLDGRVLIPVAALYPYGIFSYGLDPDRSNNAISERINIDFLKLRLSREFETTPREQFVHEAVDYKSYNTFGKLNFSAVTRGTICYQAENGQMNGLTAFWVSRSEYDPDYNNFLGYVKDGAMEGAGLYTHRRYESPAMYVPRENNAYERGIFRKNKLYDGIKYQSGGVVGIVGEGYRNEGAFVDGYQRRSVVESAPQKKTRFGYRILCEGEVKDGAFCGYYRAYGDDGTLTFEGQHGDYNE